MSRVKLLNGQQNMFLNRVAKYFDLDWAKIAIVSNICERTLRAWRAEEYNMSYEALIKLHKVSSFSIPKIVNILPEYWSAKKFARKGALRRHELYGDVDTLEGRRRGGINAQCLFRSNPKYAALHCIKTRKPINEPKLSIELAEFIGIMLGDGGMTDYQINITFNTQTDKEYGIYINKLLKRLFLISPVTINTNCDNADRIIASSKNLVQFLQEKGLKIGNKVKQRVDVPVWVLKNKNYVKSCLRGLID
ncbi:MAG: hypothetical protein NTY47_06970, partial [Candidatus Omnitrophica bacterium]|nr:hypothetical protein [Candidatus Omnitrophota bacterium]